MTLVLQTPLQPYTIPFELLTWQPKPTDIKIVFKNGDYERKIHTNIEIDPSERELIKQVRALQLELSVSLKRSMESRILRHLSHSRSDVPKALESLAQTQEWRRNFFNPPLSDAPDSLGSYLNDGFVYFCGRDCGFRPMLFVKPSVAFNKGWTLHICQQLFAFALEFAIRYLFVPGKVECVMVVLDVSNCSTWQLRCEELRSIASLLSKTYVGRLYTLLVVNAPTFVAGLWGLAKNFVSDRQQSKTVFCKKMKDVRTIGRCAKHQVEEKYGGSLPNLETVYPFTLPPGPFHADYEGAPQGGIMGAYKCVSSVTCIGKIAEDAQIVPRIKWSRKGASILQRANITIPERDSKRLRQRGSEQLAFHREGSIVTDFPEDDREREADFDDGEARENTPRGRTAGTPLGMITEVKAAIFDRQDEHQLNGFSTCIDEGSGDGVGKPTQDHAEIAVDILQDEFGGFDIDDDGEEVDSAVSDRVITVEEAEAAISRLQKYRNRMRAGWARKFWCCSMRKTGSGKRVKVGSPSL